MNKLLTNIFFVVELSPWNNNLKRERLRLSNPLNWVLIVVGVFYRKIAFGSFDLKTVCGWYYYRTKEKGEV
jgi:hypothetical protein